MEGRCSEERKTKFRVTLKRCAFMSKKGNETNITPLRNQSLFVVDTV